MLLLTIILLAAIALAAVFAELWLPKVFARGSWVTCFGLRGRFRGDVIGFSGPLLQVRHQRTGHQHLVLPFLARR